MEKVTEEEKQIMNEMIKELMKMDKEERVKLMYMIMGANLFTLGK